MIKQHVLFPVYPPEVITLVVLILESRIWNLSMYPEDLEVMLGYWTDVGLLVRSQI